MGASGNRSARGVCRRVSAAVNTMVAREEPCPLTVVVVEPQTFLSTRDGRRIFGGCQERDAR
jgi:hypothetical protein